MEIKKVVFIKSATSIQDSPIADLPEFALIWRSNVWKSTLINMITWIKDLAKASNKPGKTQLMNFFCIDESWNLVDLPWYGYAKTWTKDKVVWMDTMQRYFMQRKTLAKVFVLIDINIPVQKLDMDFVQELDHNDIPFDIIVTKMDKSNQKDLHKNISELRQELKLRFRIIPNIFLTSSIKKYWREELLDYIDESIRYFNKKNW